MLLLLAMSGIGMGLYLMWMVCVGVEVVVHLLASLRKGHPFLPSLMHAVERGRDGVPVQDRCPDCRDLLRVWDGTVTCLTCHRGRRVAS